ncbi:hypothetical protein [Leptothermofonsia sp. ETS-13]|uniref:hypothetical protein n=1 Tax=Leptothermofonsia sp. ETS-13 TaxID=3035696 RepID=UPI003B9F7B2A
MLYARNFVSIHTAFQQRRILRIGTIPFPSTARREYGYHSGSLLLSTPQPNGYWTDAIVH